jgi:tetratricopeptide (TPR) repeat protein
MTLLPHDALGAASPPERRVSSSILDLLASLVDQSLVRTSDGPAGEPRFTMLETIREFALEQVTASGEAALLRDPHAQYFLRLAEAAEPHLEGPGQATVLDQQDAELANFRAALGWLRERQAVDLALRLACALRLFWFARGHLAEGRRWLSDLLAIGAPVEPALRARALNTAGFLSRYQGDYVAAIADDQEALALHRAAADPQGIADALSNLGYALLHHGEPAAARAHYEQALVINRTFANRQGVADDLSHLATIALETGDAETARQLHQESLVIWREVGDRMGEAWALYRVGLALLRQGERAAQDFFRDSLQLAAAIGFPLGVAEALEGLAALAAARRAPEQALRLVSAAAKLREERGLPLASASQAALIGQVEAVGRRLPVAIATAASVAGWELPLDQILVEALAIASTNEPLARA